MNANTWIRRIHRWLSITFVAAVIFTSVAIAKKGPMWMSYVPLFPLFALAMTGLYMFFLPYVARLRGGAQRVGSRA